MLHKTQIDPARIKLFGEYAVYMKEAARAPHVVEEAAEQQDATIA